MKRIYRNTSKRQGPSGPGRTTAAKPATTRPQLKAEQIKALTSRFDAEKWNATADADRAAEQAAKKRAAKKQAAKQAAHA